METINSKFSCRFKKSCSCLINLFSWWCFSLYKPSLSLSKFLYFSSLRVYFVIQKKMLFKYRKKDREKRTKNLWELKLENNFCFFFISRMVFMTYGVVIFLSLSYFSFLDSILLCWFVLWGTKMSYTHKMSIRKCSFFFPASSPPPSPLSSVHHILLENLIFLFDFFSYFHFIFFKKRCFFSCLVLVVIGERKKNQERGREREREREGEKREKILEHDLIQKSSKYKVRNICKWIEKDHGVCFFDWMFVCAFVSLLFSPSLSLFLSPICASYIWTQFQWFISLPECTLTPYQPCRNPVSNRIDVWMRNKVWEIERLRYEGKKRKKI